ncbi:OmpH family outer membrane protein [Syntrophorhabdus aromaticivorans]|uniref:OmpH family outer membrane protein n=1 Tax=Syntrophorhabdus aromaticivorans TaxID=328301 RepID=A0A351U5D7_9BACT|nr:OmpH family outer membrane protein [Syntrophorhabdus aromaticivorans]NLW34516.1 OmpH family outer membrane protein [Syntrophorhabdus aromaticivorans]HBA55168.1 OmpH family outer membrane protein [Syntrophorhabdus aromaticivorans]
MKNILLIAMMIVIFAFPAVAKGQALNVVYIDVQKVMVESEKGKEAKQTLSQEAERLRKNLDSKQSELQKMKDAIEKQGATITPDARAEKEKQYQSKLKDYQRLVSDYQTELQQKDMEFTQKILKDIDDVVKTLGEKEKYTLILEKSQSGILFASPSIDITSKVISLVNETAKKKQPAKK